MEKKSLAQLSETSLNDPRLHHEVTLVVIDSHPNSPWKLYASDNDCGGLLENKGKVVKKIKENKHK